MHPKATPLLDEMHRRNRGLRHPCQIWRINWSTWALEQVSSHLFSRDTYGRPLVYISDRWRRYCCQVAPRYPTRHPVYGLSDAVRVLDALDHGDGAWLTRRGYTWRDTVTGEHSTDWSWVTIAKVKVRRAKNSR